MERVVSLIPSATEIVGALGLEDRLVGRSHECDHPASVGRLPALTEPKLDPDGSSREIDDRVKQLLRDGVSVYRIFADRLRALEPTVILTQSQCEVCAVSLADVEAAVCDWIGPDVRVVSLEPRVLGDVWGDIRRVADALGAPGRGEELVASLLGRVEAVAKRVAGQARPRVATIEWIDPIMAGGNWMPELVELAGGANLFGRAGEHSPWLDWEELRGADPDVLLVAPCGFPIAQSRAELPALAGCAGWSELRAVREGRVFVADGNQYFNRPGPRLVESLEILAELLHPERFDFGHRGRGWEPYAR